MTGTALRALRGIALILVSVLGLTTPIGAQAPYQDRGAVAAGLLLRQLDGVKRVLMIGAHPDDEDTSLLATLSRGIGARTAYLSLTRGEGGQNLIGLEMGAGLGIVRTGELVAARELDGAEQYFTRAYDFGYSKSSEEAFRFWPREEILADVVQRIRVFRPHVIVSVFSGTPRDGHGHHQAAGILAHEAFDAAADPARFPEQLTSGVEPWQTKKLYRRVRRSPEEATASLETGVFDPLLGRSYFQLAMESRSQHRSQDMGMSQPLGPRSSGFQLVRRAGAEVDGEDEAIFAGVDTTLVGLASTLPPERASLVLPHLEAYRRAVHAAIERLDALRPDRAAPPLATAVREAVAALVALAEATPASTELGEELMRRIHQAEEALLVASSVVLDVRVTDELVVLGEETTVEAQLWNGGAFEIRGARFLPDYPQEWGVEPTADDAAEEHDVPPGTIQRWTKRIRTPDDARLSRLYFLQEARDGAVYRWPRDSGERGLPGNLPQLRGTVRFRLMVPEEDGFGGPIAPGAYQPAEYVGVDPVMGEYREPLLVAPPLSVAVEPRTLPWPSGSSGTRRVEVRVRSELSGPSEVDVALDAPPGWRVEPHHRRITIEGSGAEQAVSFDVAPESGMRDGRYRFRAMASIVVSGEQAGRREASDASGSYSESFTVIDYPHIERTLYFEPSTVSVSLFPVEVRGGLRVGYVMGSGDYGIEALRHLGVDVEILDPEQVRAGDFSGFDVVVLGVRAYETRTDLLTANELLLDFARRGGTVVAQYNRYEYPGGGFAPYPVEMSRPHDRVSDETAPVTLLDPDAPVFTSPNLIGPSDFDGWIQERGLYFLSEWDEGFTPLLEMSDSGEDPKRGGLVVAAVGEGVYIYTGLAFFRQFPAGVPGAYRLFANLVSLTGGAWREYLGSR